MRILIRGAGVAGLVAAHQLLEAGHEVHVHDRAAMPGAGASRLAGGMLAPYCERENADEAVLTGGIGAADWWDRTLPGSVIRKGTLVVAPPRDEGELTRFASRTRGFEWLGQQEIRALEPDLGTRFRKGLFFRDEAHLDPRAALSGLAGKIASRGGHFQFGRPAADETGFDRIVDCTGAAAIAAGAGLRGVRGEMVVLETPEIRFSRPVRLLHPRIPLYVVPRKEHRFMVGATMIESEASGLVTARSLMELLNAAYALNPAFGEAAVVETGAGLRPAYADNLPALSRDGRTIRMNGLYRHGFLLAPALAAELARSLAEGGGAATPYALEKSA